MELSETVLIVLSVMLVGAVLVSVAGLGPEFLPPSPVSVADPHLPVELKRLDGAGDFVCEYAACDGYFGVPWTKTLSLNSRFGYNR